jgi:RimJ/RimL family protein N-acetyltransferase
MTADPIRLRPVREDDFWLFERQADDPDAAGRFNWAGFKNVRRTRQQFDEDGLIGRDGGTLVVAADGAVAGCVIWRRVTYGNPEWWCWNIGISLLPEFRRRGVGPVAQAMLVEQLFDTTVASRVEAYTDVENTAEQRALEKIGFTREGTIRSTQFRQGEWRDLYIYSILRSEAKPVHPYGVQGVGGGSGASYSEG